MRKEPGASRLWLGLSVHLLKCHHLWWVGSISISVKGMLSHQGLLEHWFQVILWNTQSEHEKSKQQQKQQNTPNPTRKPNYRTPAILKILFKMWSSTITLNNPSLPWKWNRHLTSKNTRSPKAPNLPPSAFAVCLYNDCVGLSSEPWVWFHFLSTQEIWKKSFSLWSGGEGNKEEGHQRGVSQQSEWRMSNLLAFC